MGFLVSCSISIILFIKLRYCPSLIFYYWSQLLENNCWIFPTASFVPEGYWHVFPCFIQTEIFA